MSTAMKIGGGEATEKESSGGFQFEAVDFEPCFVKEHEIKVRLASWLQFPASLVCRRYPLGVRRASKH